MHPQQPHFQQQNGMAPDESPAAAQSVTNQPPLPPLDELPTTRPPRASSRTAPPGTPSTALTTQSGRPTRPAGRRGARPTMPIRPPTLPGLEDEVRSADSEVRSEVRSMALAPLASQGALVPARNGHETNALLIRGAVRPPRPATRIVPRHSGRRSFWMQFLVAMLASVVLVSTVTLTTPLGQSMAAATTGQFTTSSSAFLWVPTPTATATPRPKLTYPSPGNNPGKQAVVNDIIAIFGQYSQGALHIAACESGYDPNARNTYPIGNSHASGVFQILYPSTWDTTSYAAYSPFDYDKNIRAAYQIFSRDGYSWREWACKPY